MKKYIIDKDNPNEKLLYYNVDVVGLSVTPNKSVPGYKITAKKLTLVDPDLREAYIKFNYTRHAKATDIEEWFEIRQVMRKDSLGKKSRAYEIIKKK